MCVFIYLFIAAGLLIYIIAQTVFNLFFIFFIILIFSIKQTLWFLLTVIKQFGKIKHLNVKWKMIATKIIVLFCFALLLALYHGMAWLFRHGTLFKSMCCWTFYINTIPWYRILIALWGSSILWLYVGYTISGKVKEKYIFFRLAEFSCVTNDKLKLLIWGGDTISCSNFLSWAQRPSTDEILMEVIWLPRRIWSSSLGPTDAIICVKFKEQHECWSEVSQSQNSISVCQHALSVC